MVTQITSTTGQQKTEEEEDESIVDKGKKIWVHYFALAVWASTVFLIFMIALSKEF